MADLNKKTQHDTPSTDFLSKVRQLLILERLIQGAALVAVSIATIVLTVFAENFLHSKLAAGVFMFAAGFVSLYLIFNRKLIKDGTLPGISLTWFGVMSILAAVLEWRETPFNLDLITNLNLDTALMPSIFSILVGICCRNEFIKEMKNVAHATEATNYLKKKSVNITKRNDTFVVYEKWRGGTLVETSTDINKENS